MRHQAVAFAPGKARTFVKTKGPARPARPALPDLLRRVAVRTLAALAPALTERLATRLFALPRPARRIAAPVLDVPAHRFRMRAGGDELTVTEWGEGPTVLVTHGWNGHVGQMTRLAQALVARGYHVVAFEQPGHRQGGSRHVTIRDMRDAVLAVGQRMAPVHAIVAHSLGATASALAVAAGLQVDRVVLLAPPAEVPPFVRVFGAWLGLPPERVSGMIDRVRHLLGGDLDAYDVRRLAPAMNARLLVVHDPDDAEVPFAHGSAIARAWPDGRLAPAPGLGHRGILRDAEVIEKVVRFVAAGRRDHSIEPASSISVMRRS